MSTKCFHCKDDLWDEGDHERLKELEKEIASLKEQLEESSSLVKDSFEIICMTCTKRSNIDNRIKVQAWLKKARVTQARREK